MIQTCTGGDFVHWWIQWNFNHTWDNGWKLNKDNIDPEGWEGYCIDAPEFIPAGSWTSVGNNKFERLIYKG